MSKCPQVEILELKDKVKSLEKQVDFLQASNKGYKTRSEELFASNTHYKQSLSNYQDRLSASEEQKADYLERLVGYQHLKCKIKELKRVSEESEDGDTAYIGYFVPHKGYIDDL